MSRMNGKKAHTPWWLATVQSIPWLPITVHQVLCNTVVAAYRGKRYGDEKSLPRKALGITNPILTVTKEIALFRSYLNRNSLFRPHPKQYHANIEISVISRYHGNCYRESIKLSITVTVTHTHTCITELSLLRNACLGGSRLT